ncbi:MAG TPA: macrolide ABC transporter ATP-binding protein [Firmicutes bacterium]|nr:macrolide ABC transporter ATP-binding protein [Bacillota bacterium]
MKQTLIKMAQVYKTYHLANEPQTVLKEIDLEVKEGEFISVLGPSGSGKSTLMNILGCLDVPSEGSYELVGNEITHLSDNELAAIRSKEIGFIFQSFYLLPRLTALQNVELPLIYARVPRKERLKRAEEMLIRVGLGDRLNHYPNQLSGGQQQRVAIARALCTNPSILLADEPTGALDQKTGRAVMDLFKELHDEGRTIIMITHDENIAKEATRIVRILDGEIVEGGALHV